jgi:hypothetical protein
VHVRQLLHSAYDKRMGLLWLLLLLLLLLLVVVLLLGECTHPHRGQGTVHVAGLPPFPHMVGVAAGWAPGRLLMPSCQIMQVLADPAGCEAGGGAGMTAGRYRMQEDRG